MKMIDAVKKVKKCVYCGKKYASTVVVCPNCGGTQLENIEPKKYSRFFFIACMTAMIGLLMAVNTIVVSITSMIDSCKKTDPSFSLEKMEELVEETSSRDQRKEFMEVSENELLLELPVQVEVVQEISVQEESIQEKVDMDSGKYVLGDLTPDISETEEGGISELPDKITEEQYQMLRRNAEETITIYTAQSMSESYSLAEMKYLGFVQCYEKGVQKTTSQERNLFVIYQVKISNPNAFWNYDIVYCPVCYSDLSTDQDIPAYGECTIIGTFTLSGTQKKYSGYYNPYDCYEELTIENMGRYDVQVGGEFGMFAENDFVTNLSSIPEEVREMMYSNSHDRVENYLAKACPTSWKIQDFDYFGEAFMVYKCPVKNGVWNNKYYIVYSAKISNDDYMIPTTVYFPVIYAGIVNLEGKVEILRGNVYDTQNKIPCTYYYNLYDIKGIVDGPSVFKYVVADNRDEYNVAALDSIMGLNAIT